MFSRSKIVYFSIILCSLISASWSVRRNEETYTNDWLVKIEGGVAVADLIARKHGFINRGQVMKFVDFLPLNYDNFNNRSMMWKIGIILYMWHPHDGPEEV